MKTLLLSFLTILLFVPPPSGALSKLKPNQQLSIDYTSSGCFGGSNQKLVIKNEGAQLVARLYKIENRDYPSKHWYVTEVLQHSKTLTQTDIAVFLKFEQELVLNHNGYCTSRETYVITSNYWNTKVHDGSCSWNGFYQLTKTWFGTNPTE